MALQQVSFVERSSLSQRVPYRRDSLNVMTLSPAYMCTYMNSTPRCMLLCVFVDVFVCVEGRCAGETQPTSHESRSAGNSQVHRIVVAELQYCVSKHVKHAVNLL